MVILGDDRLEMQRWNEAVDAGEGRWIVLDMTEEDELRVRKD